MKIATATLIGFAIMGFIGFAVKLVHIPINNILGTIDVPLIFSPSFPNENGYSLLKWHELDLLNIP